MLINEHPNQENHRHLIDSVMTIASDDDVNQELINIIYSEKDVNKFETKIIQKAQKRPQNVPKLRLDNLFLNNDSDDEDSFDSGITTDRSHHSTQCAKQKKGIYNK